MQCMVSEEAVTFMIGDSQVGVDRDGNIHINNVEFPATKGLWELLTRKRVEKNSVTTADIKQYDNFGNDQCAFRRL